MPDTPEFRAWPKIPRLDREIIVTEKIDGTNACVVVTEDGGVHAQSRKRIITPDADNFGFAAWVRENADALRTLGVGYHFGEWYGKGIQRHYDLDHRRFALFNQLPDQRPSCVERVPILGTYDTFDTEGIRHELDLLVRYGSHAVPGFDRPEGIVIYHTASGRSFKKLIENDNIAKGLDARLLAMAS